jgi:hypothetical protein
MTTGPAKRRRWTLRFSLRSLLLATLILGCGFGWLAAELQRAKRQKDAVAHIRGVRGHATYAHQLDPERDWPGARLLRAACGNDFLGHVHRVSIHHARDQDLDYLSSLSRLRDLRLNSRHITDVGLSHLRGLNNLERLDLSCEQVTDQGLQHIGGLERLETLDLYGTQVSDAGLLQLRGLTRLRALKVRHTHVTSAGVASLRELLPDCKVSGVELSDQT